MKNATDGVISAPDAPIAGDPERESPLEEPDEDLRTRYTRLSADLQNVRRRAELERAELMRYGAEPLSRGLLPVLDNLRRALDAAAPTDPLVEGLRQVVRQFEEVLATHGVEPVETVGRRFDPGCHEAVLADERPDVEEDTVTAELRPGYRLHQRVLRPAQVVVSRRPDVQGN